MSAPVLVVRAGALGDTLMATPVVRAIAEAEPGTAIDFLCSAAAAPLLETNPRIRRVLPLRQRNLPWVISPEKRRLARELREAGYRYAVLLESAARYRQPLERAGIREIRSFRETPPIPTQHSIVNNLRAGGFPAQSTDMEIYLTGEDEGRARDLLRDARAPLVGLHAGYGPPRRKRNQGQRLKGWGAANFAQLARMLIERGVTVVLTGSPDDRAEADTIAARLPPGSFLHLVGRTSVRELAAVIRRLRLYISVDSGPAHISAAAGTPLIVLWGPAIYEQVRPLSSTTPIQVVRHPVYCAPCYGTPMMRACMRNICMESISPERVMAVAQTFLSAPAQAVRPAPLDLM